MARWRSGSLKARLCIRATILSGLNNMARSAQAVLSLVVLTMLCIIAVWQSIGRFSLDVRTYLAFLTLLPAPACIYLFYTFRRPDRRVASMSFGLCFLVVFAPCCAILTYFSLSLGLHRVDVDLAAFDRALGVDWQALTAFAARHPAFNAVLSFVYKLSVWQVLALLIILGWKAPDPVDIDKLCIAIMICGIGTILVWIMLPSIGASAVYVLPDMIDKNVHASVDNAYTRDLIRLYEHGPGMITPSDVRGVVGFPSFHTEEAIVVTWFARRLRLASLVFLVFNILVLLSCPIQGGHHVADVLGGFALAMAAIAVSERLINFLERGRMTANQALLPSQANAN